MVSTMDSKKPKRAGRSFTKEFKAGAVKLILDQGKTPSRRSLGISI